MIDKNDPKQLAEAYRITAEYCYKRDYGSMADRLLREADDIDPPYKVDRSLRGWVLVVGPTSRSVWWACRDGLQQWATIDDQIDYSWATVEDYGWRVTKLNILQPGEVAVSILPTSEWPHGCEFIRIVLLFESATGRTINESFERIFDRKDAERMEAENDRHRKS